MSENKTSKHKLIFLILTLLLLLPTMFFVGVNSVVIPTQTGYLEGGIFPSAASYTIWLEGSTYFSKNMYGQIDYSSSNKTYIIEQSYNALSVVGGILYLKNIQFGDVIRLPSEIISIIEDYEGYITYYGVMGRNIDTSKLYVTRINLEGVFRELGLNWNSSGSDFPRGGSCFDPTNHVFYSCLANFTADDSLGSIVIKIDAFGAVITQKLFTSDLYLYPVVANGGKLYVIEGWQQDSKIDQLSTTDLSYIETTVTLNDGDNGPFCYTRVTDTILCVLGGPRLANDDVVYWQINLNTKAKTFYTGPSCPDADRGISKSAVLYEGYIYSDQYQTFQGNYRINVGTDGLGPWTAALIPGAPSTTYDSDPSFVFNDVIFCAGGGAGAYPPQSQPSYWYNTITGVWTEVDPYPANSDTGSLWQSGYFPRYNRTIVQQGASGYFNAPADQWILNLNTNRWTCVTNKFDGVYSKPNSYDGPSSDASVTPKRLSWGSTGGFECDNQANAGEHGCGFTYQGKYVFLMHFWVWSGLTGNDNFPILAFGTW